MGKKAGHGDARRYRGRAAHDRRPRAAHAGLAAPPLSALTGADVFVKYENLQVTNSFKERGACVKLAALSAAERRRGVIAMSAGNHAQAVAYHARRLAHPGDHRHAGDDAVRESQSNRGARRHGCSRWRDADGMRRRVPKRSPTERDLVWVHPYDDPHIIAGQGTIALEMLEEVPDLDVLVVPIGGGGLIAGCAIAARANKPSIEIVGVECTLYPSMWNALHQGNRPCGGATLAEGIAVTMSANLRFRSFANW